MGNKKYSKEELRHMAPVEIRRLIRAGEIDEPTCGMADGYAQGNLVILPKEYAYDFLLYAQRNPKPCPILEVSDAGSRNFVQMGADSDIARDFPRYRIYEYGKMTGEYTDVSSFWRADFVSFLIGCSFSFEADLLENNVPVRQIEEGRNVPMYDTSIPCQPAGVFHGNMVVSMRPIPSGLIPKAVQITAAMARVHGAPVHIGNPAEIGIKDINAPDYGEAVTIRPGEIPVFWACGVTPQNAVIQSKLPFVITHAPGHMFITDVRNADLKY